VTLRAVKLATGPNPWGVDSAEDPGNPPWQRVLDEIKQAGLGAVELGPVGYLPEDPVLLRQALAGRELTAVGSFVFEGLHDPSASSHVLDVADRACRAINAAGGRVLVIIDRPGRERAATAGRSDEAPRLSTGRWLLMVRLINELAELARENGLVPACHPHAGSYIEFSDEIDRLLTDCPEIGLCLDTGHATYAGIPAEEAITAYASRLVHVHLKDTDARVLDTVRREQLGFWQSIGAGVFCPIGRGLVDPRRVACALERAGYEGFATIEQDRRPGSGAPLEDLQQSIAVLSNAGFGTPLTGSASEVGS
jgi:inosose dehydratase